MPALSSNEHKLAASSALRGMQSNPDPKLAQTYALKAIAHMMAARELPDCEYCKHPFGYCVCPEPDEVIDVYNPSTGQVKHAGTIPVVPGGHRQFVNIPVCELKWLDTIQDNHIHKCALDANHAENCTCSCGGVYYPHE